MAHDRRSIYDNLYQVLKKNLKLEDGHNCVDLLFHDPFIPLDLFRFSLCDILIIKGQ